MAQMMTKDISLEEETKYCNDEDDMIYKDENGGFYKSAFYVLFNFVFTSLQKFNRLKDEDNGHKLFSLEGFQKAKNKIDSEFLKGEDILNKSIIKLLKVYAECKDARSNILPNHKEVVNPDSSNHKKEDKMTTKENSELGSLFLSTVEINVVSLTIDLIKLISNNNHAITILKSLKENVYKPKKDKEQETSKAKKMDNTLDAIEQKVKKILDKIDDEIAYRTEKLDMFADKDDEPVHATNNWVKIDKADMRESSNTNLDASEPSYAQSRRLSSKSLDESY